MDDACEWVFGLEDEGGGWLRSETGGSTDCSASSYTVLRTGVSAVKGSVGGPVFGLFRVSGSSFGSSFTSWIRGSPDRREGVLSPTEDRRSSSLRKCGDLGPGEPLPEPDIVLWRDRKRGGEGAVSETWIARTESACSLEYTASFVDWSTTNKANRYPGPMEISPHDTVGPDLSTCYHGRKDMGIRRLTVVSGDSAGSREDLFLPSRNFESFESTLPIVS